MKVQQQMWRTGKKRKDENLPHYTMLVENTFINVESQNEMQKEAWALTLPSNANSHRSRQNHAQEVNTGDRLHKDNISIVEWVGDLKNRGKKMKTLCRRSWMLCIKGGWESEKALYFVWWKSLVKQMQWGREYRLQLRSDMKGPTRLPCEHIQKARWKHSGDGSSRGSTVSNLIRSRWISNWWMFPELSVSKMLTILWTSDPFASVNWV